MWKAVVTDIKETGDGRAMVMVDYSIDDGRTGTKQYAVDSKDTAESIRALIIKDLTELDSFEVAKSDLQTLVGVELTATKK